MTFGQFFIFNDFFMTISRFSSLRGNPVKQFLGHRGSVCTHLVGAAVLDDLRAQVGALNRA